MRSASQRQLLRAALRRAAASPVTGRCGDGDEPAPELGVLGEGGAAIAGGVEPAHERAVDLLRERLESGLATGQRNRLSQVAAPFGGGRELLEHRDETVAVFLLRLVRPVIVEPGRNGPSRSASASAACPATRRRSASRTSTQVWGARPTRSRVATSASSPSARRNTQSALRRLARALSSRTLARRRTRRSFAVGGPAGGRASSGAPAAVRAEAAVLRRRCRRRCRRSVGVAASSKRNPRALTVP